MSDLTIVIIWVVKIFFVQFFCVFLPPLLNNLISVRSILFLSFIVPIFAWNVPLVTLIFLKRPLVFPILLFSFISLHWSLRKAFLSLFLFFETLHTNGYLFPFLLCLLLLFFSQLFVSFLRQPFCLAAFLFLGYGFGHHLLYDVTNLCP